VCRPGPELTASCHSPLSSDVTGRVHLSPTDVVHSIAYRGGKDQLISASEDVGDVLPLPLRCLGAGRFQDFNGGPAIDRVTRLGVLLLGRQHALGG
jgi:hypothetical protein